VRNEIIFAGTGDAFNTDGFANQAIVLGSKTRSFLIDAGPTTLCELIRLGIAPEGLSGIFITHFHGDHTGGLPFLFLYLKLKIKSIKLPFIAGPEGIKEKSITLFDAAFPGEKLEEGIEFLEIPVTATDSIKLTPTIEAGIYPMKHKPESIGYRFYYQQSVISVTGDTGINDNMIPLFHRADIGIIECSSVEPEKDVHVSLRELKANIDRFECSGIVPIHRSQKVMTGLKEWAHPKIRIVADGGIIRL
jgi:ribonuclease BN (tRNA processing enzyme)